MCILYLFYNNLSNVLKNDIDEYHFKQFLEMENQILKSEKIISKGIPSIIAKELIKYVKPLIIEIPKNKYLKKYIQLKKNKPSQEINIKHWFIALQNEKPTNIINTNFK